MEIKIDTKNDSKQDLKNVIRLLQNIVGESEENNFNSYNKQNLFESQRTESFNQSRYPRQENNNTINNNVSDNSYETPSPGLFDIFNSSKETENDEIKEKDYNLYKNNIDIDEKREEEKDKKISLVPY